MSIALGSPLHIFAFTFNFHHRKNLDCLTRDFRRNFKLNALPEDFQWLVGQIRTRNFSVALGLLTPLYCTEFEVKIKYQQCYKLVKEERANKVLLTKF